jgi:hypothetical protein
VLKRTWRGKSCLLLHDGLEYGERTLELVDADDGLLELFGELLAARGGIAELGLELLVAFGVRHR